MYFVYSTAVTILFTTPSIYCAPTIRPRQFPDGDFGDVLPTLYPTPDVTFPDDFDPFNYGHATPTLSVGAIIGVAIGCMAAIALLFALFYWFHQSDKQQRTLERQLALAAANNNNNNNNSNPDSQRREQNTVTSAATGSMQQQQQANFNYGAEHQPYQPYREQPPSYLATPNQPPSESYAMGAMFEHTQQSSSTQLNNESSIVSAEVHTPPPHYVSHVSKPDAVHSS